MHTPVHNQSTQILTESHVLIMATIGLHSICILLHYVQLHTIQVYIYIYISSGIVIRSFYPTLPAHTMTYTTAHTPTQIPAYTKNNNKAKTKANPRTTNKKTNLAKNNIKIKTINNNKNNRQQ